MSDSTLTGHKFKKDGLLVVDVDVHAHETPAVLAPYCEMPWRKTLEHLSTVPARYLDIPGFAPSISLWPSFPQSGGDRRNTVTSAAQHAPGPRPARRRHRRDFSRPPAAARRPQAGRLRRRAGAGLQPLAGRRVADRGQWPQGRAARAAPQHPRHAADEIRRYAGHPHRRRRLPADLLPSTRSTATAATTRCSPPPRRPACRSCCTASPLVHPIFPVQPARLRDAVRHPPAGAPLRDDCQPGQHDGNRRARALPRASRSPSPRAASPGCRGSCCGIDKEYAGAPARRAHSSRTGPAPTSGACSSPPSRSRSPSTWATWPR